MADKEVAYLPHWLVKGEKDPFPNYLDRDRADLPMCDFSDDALGNYLFMNYDRTVDMDVAIMMMIGRGEKTEHVTRIHMATAIKERLRWLSRQLLIAEGKYPGKEKPLQIDAEKVWTLLGYDIKIDEYSPDVFTAMCEGVFPTEFVEHKLKEHAASASSKGANKQGVETLAKEIYNSWSGQVGWVPWVEGGNSLNQTRARSLAAENLAKQQA